MNVGELIAKLSRLDPDLPVVMRQYDEPLGDYEVLDVDVVRAAPDELYHSSAPRGTWDYPQVWNAHSGFRSQIVLLDSEPPWRPTIEGEIAPCELPSG